MATFADYQNAACPTDEPERSLDRIGAIAANIEEYNNVLRRFVDRFHGVSKTEGAASALAPVPCGHAGQLQRLGDATSELGKLAHEVSCIG